MKRTLMCLSDVVLVRISQTDLTLGELVKSVELREAFDKAVDLAIVRHCVRAAAEAHDLEPDEEQVETRMTVFRESRRLYKADDMVRWLETNHFELGDLEEEFRY
ncbi:MAG TPA: hypothetical protein VGO93_09820, partial [Candidatus Xenobia bacterium]